MMGKKLVMVKHMYRWVLGIGILLVLVGVGVFVQVTSAHDARLAQQNLRVAQAVSQLEGCATCHELTNQTSVVSSGLARTVSHTLIALPEAKPQVRTATPVEARLADAGQRILALSASDYTPQVGAAADSFLRIYEQNRAASNSTADQLTALDSLEYWLQNLEHQAQTARWNVHSSEQTQTTAAWLTAVPVSSGFTAALSPCLAALMVLAGCSVVVRDGAASRQLDEVILGVHRRGPPADAHVDSVL
jgi:ABC-type nickel/cobalt efflux system permease component RcnA